MSFFVSPYSWKQKFVSFVRKFTQALLHLLYKQFSVSFDDNGCLLTNIVSVNKAIGEETLMFRYHLDSLHLVSDIFIVGSFVCQARILRLSNGLWRTAPDQTAILCSRSVHNYPICACWWFRRLNIWQETYGRSCKWSFIFLEDRCQHCRNRFQ